MVLLPYFRQAWHNLWAYKLRSMLAVLGVLVGTASVVALVSGGQLATEHALAEFKDLGTNLLSVVIDMSADQASQSKTHDLKPMVPSEAQLHALQQSSKGIDAVAAYTVAWVPVRYQGKNVASMVVGVTDDFWQILKLRSQNGRLTSVLDQQQGLCVLGDGVRQKMLQMGVFLPVKKKVQVQQYLCPVIGTLQAWPRSYFVYVDINQAVVLPYASLATMPTLSSSQILLIAKLHEHADLEQIKADIRQSTFWWLKKEQKMYFTSADQLLAKRKAQQQTFTVMLGLIGGISLLVGGIGVMNIMLVSVVERRREIGVRMAVGARQADIRMMFLCESTVLSLCGGSLGVITGIGISWVIAMVEKWSFAFFVWPPVIGFMVSVLVGVFFGYYPAYRAAKMDPITALRTE